MNICKLASFDHLVTLAMCMHHQCCVVSAHMLPFMWVGCFWCVYNIQASHHHSKLTGGVWVHQLQNWLSRPKYAQIEEHGNIPLGASSFLLSWLWCKRSLLDDTGDSPPKFWAPWQQLDFTISACVTHSALSGTVKAVIRLSMLWSTLTPPDQRSLYRYLEPYANWPTL